MVVVVVVVVRNGITEGDNRSSSNNSRVLPRQAVNYMTPITPPDRIPEVDSKGGTTGFRIKMRGLQFEPREGRMDLAEGVSASLDVVLDSPRN